MEQIYDVAVIGGWAAGLWALRGLKDKSVIIIEGKVLCLFQQAVKILHIRSVSRHVLDAAVRDARPADGKIALVQQLA